MKWTKLGRVFMPDGSQPWISSHAAVPIARYVQDDVFRVYFSGRDAQQRSRIGYVELDLRSPLASPAAGCGPLLDIGAPGTFDDSGVMPSWMLDVGGQLWLYYIGWNRSVAVPFRNAIGLGMSDDQGRSFARYAAGPILDRGVHDPCFVSSPCVLAEAGRYRMWYLSCLRWDFQHSPPVHYYHIKYAESSDGVNWERAGRVCIDFADSEEYAISRPCVIHAAGRYQMWYSYRGPAYRIGYAESADGLSWERRDDQAGIDVSESGWDAEMIEYPFVFDHNGQRYMLYNGNGYGQTGFGLAVLD